MLRTVWRIRDVYPGSRIRLFPIPDPNCLHPGSRILIKEYKYFNPPKKQKKWFQSSKKYNPGCSSRIPDPDAEFLPSRIPDPGVKKAPNPESGSATLVADPGCLSWIRIFSIPDPGSKIPDPGSGSALKNFLTHKIVSKLSEICMNLDVYPGSGSATPLPKLQREGGWMSREGVMGAVGTGGGGVGRGA
jgi:hypothetical protein